MDTFGRCAVELLTRYHLTVCIEAMSYLVAYGCGCRLEMVASLTLSGQSGSMMMAG